MIRLWGKIIKENKIISQEVSECTDKKDPFLLVDRCLQALCKKLDISEPYWLDKNKQEYKKHLKASFTQDNFIETIDFDRFEIEVIEAE